MRGGNGEQRGAPCSRIKGSQKKLVLDLRKLIIDFRKLILDFWKLILDFRKRCRL